MTNLTFSGSSPSTPLLSTQLNQSALRRQNLAPHPLGTVGNLCFTAREGGTPRACYVAALLTDAGRSVSGKWADLTSCVFMEPDDVRTRREILNQTRAYSQSMGELLGCLTAKVDNGTGRFADSFGARRIVKALLKLIRQPGGDLGDEPRKRHCLETYINELKVADLIALHNGVLSCNHARAAVLRQVPTRLFTQASDELNRIGVAVYRVFVLKVVQEPLEEVARRLACRATRQLEGRRQLVVLNKIVCQYSGSGSVSTACEENDLARYIRHLPSEQLRTLSIPISSATEEWFVRPHSELLISLLDFYYSYREVRMAKSLVRGLDYAIKKVLAERGET